MRLSIRLAFVLSVAASSCGKSSAPQPQPETFAEAVRRAEKIVLHEGLPHQMFEKQLETELRTKPVEKLHGYPFYQETLSLRRKDANVLRAVLGEETTYEPFSGEKACGGFHPDYALEWHVGDHPFVSLICFGCQEVKLFGPAIESRNNLNKAAGEKLGEILKSYRKNRPSP